MTHSADDVPASETDAEAQATDAEATDADEAVDDSQVGQPKGFTRWRKTRPFIAGLFMILSGAIILMPAYLSFEISNIMIQISTLSGVSTFIIGALLIVSGLMTWFGGGSRFLTGVAALILGLVALPTSNFGGFVLGTLFALIGGALALSWTDASKQDVKQARAAKKAARQQKKDQRSGGSGDNNSKGSAAAVTAAIVATALGATVTAQVNPPTANAQLKMPTLQDLQEDIDNLDLPGLNLPGQNNSDKPESPNTPEAPKLPSPPKMPKPPKLPAPPKMPKPPKLPKIEAPEVPEDLQMDLTPPGPIEGLQTVHGETFTIKTDSTALLGDMKLSMVDLETAQGTKPAIRIDANKAVLENLSMRMPGFGDQAMWQRTGAGLTSVLEGNFHIIVKKMTVTPAISGLKTFPITIDANWAPKEIRKELAKVGLGQPDKLAEQLTMLDAELDAYIVKADSATLPAETTIAP